MAEKRRSSDRLFALATKHPRFTPLHPKICVGSKENIAIMQKQLQKNPQLLEYCSKYGDHETAPPLISAVLLGHEKCIKFLLESGASVDAVGSVKCNALVTAYLYVKNNIKKKAIITLLLKYKSDPYSGIGITDDHMPLFIYLILSNSIEYVELFLQLGTNPNSVRHSLEESSSILSSLSCLNFAVSKNYHEIVELLLRYGADALQNKKFNDGISLIYVAIKLGRLKSLKHLLMYSKGVFGHLNCMCCGAISYGRLVIHSDANFDEKIKILRMLFKFGCNLWMNENVNVETEEDVDDDLEEEKKLRVELESLRRYPMSLKCLSRLAILQAMGRNFSQQSDSLEIPTTLHPFLQFSDVQV